MPKVSIERIRDLIPKQQDLKENPLVEGVPAMDPCLLPRVYVFFGISLNKQPKLKLNKKNKTSHLIDVCQCLDRCPLTYVALFCQRTKFTSSPTAVDQAY